MPRITPDQAGGVNRCALLDAIAQSELTSELIAVTDDGYNVLCGAVASAPLVFDSYATHPNVFNRRFDSTAAGRYQLLYRYWIAYKAQLALPDFGPISQDLIALQQIRECSALPLIDSGNFQGAIEAIAHIWASLPGANYGQHEQSMAYLQAAYTASGGVVA
jgi:muramidase (phage lysozyme)